MGVISKFGLGALPVPPLAMMTRATLTAQSYYYYYYYYYFVRVLLFRFVPIAIHVTKRSITFHSKYEYNMHNHCN